MQGVQDHKPAGATVSGGRLVLLGRPRFVCRFHVPDDDCDSAVKAYEWPKRFGEVLREAGTKAASEHRQFEAALKVRRKEFEQQVEQYVTKLAVVEARSDIVKREVAAAEVCYSNAGSCGAVYACAPWLCSSRRMVLFMGWTPLRLSSYKSWGVFLQATELQAKLTAAVQTAEEINVQEKMFGWGCTK